jgi:DNA-binding SARP family transcriptional activator
MVWTTERHARTVAAQTGLGQNRSAFALRFRMLGPIEVLDDRGRRVVIEGRRARRALAMLLVRRNQLVSLDALAEGMWPKQLPPRATDTLYTYVSKLRRVFGACGPLSGGERIVRRAPGYQLVTLEGEVDADRLERALGQAEAAMHEGRFADASKLLGDGLDLVAGPTLGECRDEPFARAEVARVDGVRLRALERRIDADLALGRHANLIGELEGLAAEYGLHERFHEQLMLALYRSGCQADALRAYQDARRVLAEELGLNPGPALRAMEAAILAQDPALDLAPLPSASRGIDRRGLLPPGLLAEGPFVGRRRQLEMLRESWAEALADRRRAIVIQAELGMGASRLAAEITAEAAGEGAVVLAGRSTGEAVIPYLPFVEALHPYVSGRSLEELERRAGPGASFLSELFPLASRGATGADSWRAAALSDTPPPALSDANSSRYWLFEAIAVVLEELAAPAGAVLVLDDIHEADPSTLHLLEHLALHHRPSRVLIVMTSALPAPPLLARLVAEGTASRLLLEGLSVEDVGTLLAITSGRGVETLPTLAEAVHDLTSGVPLFVEELGKALAEVDATAVRPSPDLPASERIVATLERRIDQVPPAVVSMLSTAAVMGLSFEVDMLATLTGQVPAAVAAHLDLALGAGLVRAEPLAGRYRFSHRLLHQAFDRRVGPTLRGELHGELANLLVGPAAPSETSPAEVAHHFKLAAWHHASQAVTYAIRAGDHAMGVLAFEDAEHFYTSALDTLRSFGAPDRRLEAAVLVRLGAAHFAAYRRVDAIAAYRRAVELSLDLRDSEGLAASTSGLMTSTEFSDADPSIIALLRQTMTMWDEVDERVRTRLIAGLARVLPAGDSEGKSLIDEATSMVLRVGDPETRAAVLSTAVLIKWSPDNLPWRQEVTNEVIDLAGGLGWVDLEMEARNWRAAYLEELGELAAADADLSRVEAFAVESRRPFFLGLTAMRRAGRAILEGRYEDAERESTAMLSVGGDSPDFVAGFGVQTVLVRRDQGRLAELESLVFEQIVASPRIPAWKVAGLFIDSAAGRPHRAEQGLRQLVVDEVAAIPRDWLWPLAVAGLADVCVDLNDREVAPVLIRALTPFSGRLAMLAHGIVADGTIDRRLAGLEACVGHLSKAERLLHSAVATSRRVGARPELARSLWGLAGVLDRLPRRDGDRDRRYEAGRLRVEAIEIARQLGLAGF